MKKIKTEHIIFVIEEKMSQICDSLDSIQFGLDLLRENNKTYPQGSKKVTKINRNKAK